MRGGVPPPPRFRPPPRTPQVSPNIQPKVNFYNRKTNNPAQMETMGQMGDWSRTTQMKHFMPTKNKGLRKRIHKRFKTISINEFTTSKNCCECYNELEYVNSETFRLLKCSKCLSSENKKTVFRTRDANSAINMKNLFRFYCKYRKRPKEFIRSSSVSKQNKVEQSVDFTEGNASN
jgi:hypothetical protein